MTTDTTPEPTTILVAVLDASDVYMGTASKPAADLTPDDVPLPAGCDLPPGRYRWDRAQGCFMPLPPAPEAPAAVPLDVSAMRALRALIDTLQASGTTLPAACTDWAAAYARTIDAN